MMILFNGHSLTPKDRFQAERLSLQLSERSSSASMTISDDAPVLNVDDWLQIESGPGAGIVWRVKIVEHQFDKKTRTITLEHMIGALKDRIMFGEVKSKDISGSGTINPTARQAANYILSYQNDWVLGDIAYNVSNPYNFNGDDLLSALDTVSGSLDDCIWEYDFSSYPFRLYIRHMDSSICSEMRTDRNIKTLRKTIDRSRMYTRFYPIGKNNIHITGDYVSRNENIYGTVCKVETNGDKEDEEDLRAWALERIKKHCEPAVTITISGFELASATGEPLDSFTIGKMCRVPLPEFSTMITERVTKLSYTDVIADPMTVTITLANELQDVSTILKANDAASGKSSRSQKKKDEEDHAWFVDTTEHVGLVAEAVAGPGADKDWSRVSSIFVDGEGIHQKVVRTENDIVVAQTAIELNEYKIELEAKRATAEEGKLQGKITVEADRITNEVTRAVNEERSLKGMIEVQADRVGMTVGVTDTRPIRYIYQTQYLPRPGDESVIYYCQDSKKYYEWKNSTNSYHLTEPGKYIKAGEICVAINDSGETEAVIEADKIHLLGQTIAQTISADYISSKIASLTSVDMKGATVYGNLYIRNGSGNSQNVSGAIWDLWLDRSGDTYTLKRKRIQDSSWVDVGSFSRATSLSAGWDGNRKFTVSASPQGVSRYTTLFSAVPDSDVSWSDGVGTLTLKATMDGGETSYTVGTVTVNAPGAPTALGIYDSNSTKRTGTITLGWGGSIALWGGYTTDGGTTWVWGDQVTVEGKALPQITNVDRKSSGITGTSAGDVSAKSGSYVTFKMAGYDYYIKIA